MQIFRCKSIDNNTFSRNSSQFLENSSQIPCTFRFLSLPLPSLQFTMWSIPHEQRARRYVQAQPTFSKRCGLIFFAHNLPHRYEGSKPFVHVEHSTWCGDARDRIRRFAFHVFFSPLWWISMVSCSRRGRTNRFFRTPTSTRAGAVLRQ